WSVGMVVARNNLSAGHPWHHTENYSPHALFADHDRLVRHHGLAGDRCHQADSAAGASTWNCFNLRRRHRLHGRPRILRRTTAALQPFHLALVCNCRHDLPLLRRALVRVVSQPQKKHKRHKGTKKNLPASEILFCAFCAFLWLYLALYWNVIFVSSSNTSGRTNK